MKTEALRDHVDAADDLVDSLLEWRHVVTWRHDGSSPPADAPKTTLISIDRAQVQRLMQLLDAAAAQAPQRATPGQSGTGGARGDLRAHIEKAQAIATSELQAPSAAMAGGGTLVTIDRTTLRRLDVELDAIGDLAPRAATGR